MDPIKNFQKLDIKTKKIISNFGVGNFKSLFSGKGLEFEEYKEYSFGDDSRYIDWMASSRQNKILLKKYNIEKSIKISFLLDLRESMQFGLEKKKSDLLIEIFIFLALSSVNNLNTVGGIVFNENNFKFFEQKRGKSHVFNIYNEILAFNGEYFPLIGKISPEENIGKKEKNLTSTENISKNGKFFQSSENFDKKGSFFSFNGKNNFSQMLAFFAKIKLKNNLLFILTDEIDVQNDKNLKVLALKNEIIFINIFDNFENTLESPKSSIVGLIGENGNDINIDLANNSKKEKYKKFRKEKIQELSQYLHKIGISYLQIDNFSNIYKELFYFFKLK